MAGELEPPLTSSALSWRWQGLQRSQGKMRCAEWIWARPSAQEYQYQHSAPLSWAHATTSPLVRKLGRSRPGSEMDLKTGPVADISDIHLHWFVIHLEQDNHGEGGWWRDGSPPPGPFACIPSLLFSYSIQYAGCLSTGRQKKRNNKRGSLSKVICKGCWGQDCLQWMLAL